MEQIQGQIINVGVTLICGVITMLGAIGAYYLSIGVKKLKAQTQKIQNEDLKVLVDDTLDKTEKLIKDNVVNAQENIVVGIKASADDGKITKKDGENILAIVKQNVLSQLSVSSRSVLSEELGDVESYIDIQIEKALAEIKGRA